MPAFGGLADKQCQIALPGSAANDPSETFGPLVFRHGAATQLEAALPPSELAASRSQRPINEEAPAVSRGFSGCSVLLDVLAVP